MAFQAMYAFGEPIVEVALLPILIRARTLITFGATLVCLVASSCAHSQDDLRKDPEIVALLSFVSDATTLDAMFYSVRDYCLPYVGNIVTMLAEQAWRAKIKALMESRDTAMERYAAILRQRGYNNLTNDQLRRATDKIFQREKTNNNVLNTVMNAADKPTACGHTLGAMNSSSFSFERIAPSSYEYWKHNFKP